MPNTVNGMLGLLISLLAGCALLSTKTFFDVRFFLVFVVGRRILNGATNTHINKHLVTGDDDDGMTHTKLFLFFFIYFVDFLDYYSGISVVAMGAE